MRAFLAACASTAILIGLRAQDAALPGGGTIAARTGMAHQIAGAEGEQLAQTVVALTRDAFAVMSAGGGVLSRCKHQAAKSRAERNWRPSPIAVTTACAVSPPMPGMVVSRRITGLSRATAMIRSCKLAIAVLRASICWISSRSTSTASEGMSEVAGRI